MKKFNLTSRQVAIIYYAIIAIAWIAFCIVTYCVLDDKFSIIFPFVGVVFLVITSYNMYENLLKQSEKNNGKEKSRCGIADAKTQ